MMNVGCCKALHGVAVVLNKPMEELDTPVNLNNPSSSFSGSPEGIRGCLSGSSINQLQFDSINLFS